MALKTSFLGSACWRSGPGTKQTLGTEAYYYNNYFEPQFGAATAFGSQPAANGRVFTAKIGFSVAAEAKHGMQEIFSIISVLKVLEACVPKIFGRGCLWAELPKRGVHI